MASFLSLSAEVPIFHLFWIRENVKRYNQRIIRFYICINSCLSQIYHNILECLTRWCIHPVNVLFHPPAVLTNIQTIIEQIIRMMCWFLLTHTLQTLSWLLEKSFTWCPPYLCDSGTEPANSFPPLTHWRNSSFCITDSSKSNTLHNTSWNTNVYYIIIYFGQIYYHIGLL